MNSIRKLKTILILFGLFFISSNTFTQNKKVEYNSKISVHDTLEEGYIIEKITIDGFDSRLPFYIERSEITLIKSYVILLHGLNGRKENWLNRTSPLSEKFVKLKDSLLSIGYIVIMPDAKYHGERGAETNFTNPSTFYSSQNTEQIENLWSSTVKDISIIIDYIQSITTEQSTTFEVIGYSMGGLMAIHLNSKDERLKSIIVCVPPLGNSIKNSQRLGLKVENAKKIDLPSNQIYAPLQKSPITLLMGTKDGWYTTKEARDFYDKIEIKSKRIIFYDSGHYLPKKFIGDVIQALTTE